MGQRDNCENDHSQKERSGSKLFEQISTNASILDQAQKRMKAESSQKGKCIHQRRGLQSRPTHNLQMENYFSSLLWRMLSHAQESYVLC